MSDGDDRVRQRAIALGFDYDCDDAAASLTSSDVKNVQNVSLGEKMPAPLGGDGMPALAQRLGELVEEAQKFVRCDGAWVDGAMMNSWGMSGGFAKPPPPGKGGGINGKTCTLTRITPRVHKPPRLHSYVRCCFVHLSPPIVLTASVKKTRR